MSLSAFTAIMKYWWDHICMQVAATVACAAPESVRLARLCGVSSLHRKTNNVHYYCIFVFATGTDEMEHSKKFSFSLSRRREARHRAHCSVYVFFMTLITFCYFSSSIYFAFVKSHTATNRKDASWALPREKKLQKKNFFNEQISLIFPLIGCHLLSGERNGKRQQQQNVPANEKFPLGICMQKSAAMAATTAATPSSFITGARELLHFHFWFGSLRCSFVIKENWGKEKERDGEAIEHRPVHIRTLSPRYTQADGLYVQF